MNGSMTDPKETARHNAQIEDLIERLEKATEWRAVPGWPYEASDTGALRNSMTLAPLKPTITHAGYEKVTFQENYRRKTIRVHRAVFEAFHGPIPTGMEINHLDANRCNNAPTNLEVTTTKGNADHRAKLGRTATGERHGSKTRPDRIQRGTNASLAKLDDAKVLLIRAWRAQGGKLQEIAQSYGVDQSLISQICRRKIWTHI